ncbi:hypothetical protein HNP40_002639 [Mycobacteroides chelonae]|nr:hypothetical protein [Mycobacteroides chelonae]
MVTVQRMDDSFELYQVTIDPRKHFIDLGHRIGGLGNRIR